MFAVAVFPNNKEEKWFEYQPEVDPDHPDQLIMKPIKSACLKCGLTGEAWPRASWEETARLFHTVASFRKEFEEARKRLGPRSLDLRPF